MSDVMNPMAQFFARLGHRIIQTPSALWYDVQPRVLLSLPYFRQINPTEDELNQLMRQHKIRALRFPTSLESFGFASTLAINTNPNYDLNCQHQKARNQTRRGLENCRVEPIDFDYLIKKGLPLNQDTARRQGRESQYAHPDYWRKFCCAAQATPGVSAWGAFIKGELAVFLVAIEVDDWVEWVVNHSDTAFRKQYPNNALVFHVARYFFQEKKCKGICYGLGSLEATSELDHFKQRMGWELKPIKQRLLLSQNLQWTFAWAREPCLKILNKIFPQSYTVRKTSALIRLYRQQTSKLPSPNHDKNNS